MASEKPTDRHRRGSVQLKAWVPTELRNRFNACCKAQDTAAAVALRSLVEAYCDQVEGFGRPEAQDGVHRAG